MAPYAKIGEVTLRLSTKARSEGEARKALDNLEEKILARQTFEGIALKEICYGYGEEAAS